MKTDPSDMDATCTACGLAELVDFFDAGRLPIHVGVLWDSPEQARDAPMGAVTLCWCPRCGLVHNRTFEPERVVFEPGYEVSLMHSETFRTFMENLASRLIERYDLRNKTIIEIGCGEAYFLRMLCRLGTNDAIGIDPTVKREGLVQTEGGTIRFIRDLYSERYARLEGDFVCCLSVFEDIPRPLEFLATVRKMIGNRKSGVYFEVFNGFRAFTERETWSVHYEQCNYFGPENFCGLFRRAGFEVTEAGPCYGGDQYLYVEALPGRRPEPDAGTRLEMPSSIAEFSATRARRLGEWKSRFDACRRAGRRVVVWGSGGKGISFLNTLRAEDLITHVVDINPDRQNRYIPGTAQHVVGPEFLTDYRPHSVIITNPLYEQEIREQVAQLGVSCEFFNA